MDLFSLSFFPASRHPRNSDCVGPAWPWHWEAQCRGDCQEVRLRRRLLLWQPELVAENQAQNMVHLRRTLLVVSCQGMKKLHLHNPLSSPPSPILAEIVPLPSFGNWKTSYFAHSILKSDSCKKILNAIRLFFCTPFLDKCHKALWVFTRI